MNEIIQNGHPTLRLKAKDVKKEDFGSASLLEDISKMKESLAAQEDGVALAAPQIDISSRVFIVAEKAWDDYVDQPLVYVNPTIIKRSKKTKLMDEGCLSVRWIYGKIRRHKQVTIHAFDEYGEEFTVGAGGLLSQIFQHETDHLNGVLFIDSAVNLEELTEEEVQRLKKEYEER